VIQRGDKRDDKDEVGREREREKMRKSTNREEGVGVVVWWQLVDIKVTRVDSTRLTGRTGYTGYTGYTDLTVPTKPLPACRK
jgi:hypothetical protein